jgi:hypothetical protein
MAPVTKPEKSMAHPLPPQQPERSGADDEFANAADGVLEPVESLLDLLNDLNGHLNRLEYALLDLKEALVQCDRGERGKLERQAASHLERIRLAAKDDPGFPRLTE